MAQEQIQQQKQEQRLTQSISALQLLQAQLIELPLQQMTDRMETELHDNPALEKAVGDEELPSDWTADATDSEGDDTDDFDAQREREERSDALDAALENIGRDDEDLPVYQAGKNWGDEQEQTVFGDEESFYDLLNKQVGELDISDDERYVIEYIIQSLDSDGLLRTPLSDICEQLAIYHNIDITEEEAERLLGQLQGFDPAGIGARTLQECLLLQIGRRKDSPMKELMRRTISEYFDEFTKKHWRLIQRHFSISDSQTQELIGELRRLNPKPGAAMGETLGRSIEQITPDFIVDTHDDGTISLTLNTGDMPRLEISQSFADLLKDLQENKENMTRQQKEALLYTKQKVDAAQYFIDAVNTRNRTLTKTMKAIIQLQRPFFEEGDEELLRPMILKDVAELTHLDLSTISRVSNSKYVLTRWGTFPLKFFFSDSFVTQDGEELSTRRIKTALRDIIAAEDKQKPMNDDALCDALKRQGFPIARRTVSKYREQLGLPAARLRRQ